MKPSELKSVTAAQAAALEDAGWDVEKLASADAAELTEVNGIGKKTAEKVIADAQKRWNEHNAYLSKQLADEALSQTRRPGGNSSTEFLPEPPSNAFSMEFLTLENPPAMSTRVRRQYDRERERLGLA